MGNTKNNIYFTQRKVQTKILIIKLNKKYVYEYTCNEIQWITKMKIIKKKKLKLLITNKNKNKE